MNPIEIINKDIHSNGAQFLTFLDQSENFNMLSPVTHHSRETKCCPVVT